MFTVVFFILAVALVYRQLTSSSPKAAPKAVVPAKKASPRLLQMIDFANRLWREKKYSPAEKAYLEIIKFDHKNVLAYTRLGMIYSRLKNYDEAVECFQMAAQLAPSASSYNNLGLIYFENKNHIKAVAAFEKAIMFEPSAERYLSLAKTYQKIASWPKMVSALENAVEISPTKDNLWMLAEGYRADHNKIKLAETYQRILKLDPNDSRAQRALGAVSA